LTYSGVVSQRNHKANYAPLTLERAAGEAFYPYFHTNKDCEFTSIYILLHVTYMQGVHQQVAN